MGISQVQVTINSQTYSLTYNGTSGKYEATITAPITTSYNQSGGYYSVSVVATDQAGNSTTKSGAADASCRLVVKERVAPTITNLSPSASARLTTASPTISGKVTDETNGSGIAASSFQLKLDGGAALLYNSPGMTWTPVSGGFTFSYAASGLAQGTHSYTVNVSDNDGNAATQASVSFTVDTIAPTLNVTAPANALITNQTNCTVTGTTNDTTSSPVVITITRNGVDQGAVTIDGSGNFTKVITLVNGTNTLLITATDSAGLTTQISRTVTLDTTPPTISLIELVPNPVDAGATYLIKVTATDA